MTAGEQDLPRTAAELAAACDRTRGTEAESMARRFVATHPREEQGWHVLLACVEQCGNAAEAERLARLGLERFPGSARLRLALVGALAQRGRPQEAASLLRGRDLTGDEALLLAELELASDPDEARRLYAGLLEAYPASNLAALGLRSATGLCAARPRPPAIGFLLSEDWHRWIQEPVAEALDALGIPHFFTTKPWILGMHRPRAVVLSSPGPSLVKELRALVPGARLVNTRHGISVNGKNYGLYASAACDRVCVSSEQHARETRELALLDEDRVWATGYPQMDGLFRSLPSRSPPGRRVLFAPTFNPELSAAHLVGEDAVPALRGTDATIRVVLAGHPRLRSEAPRLVAAWKRQAETLPNVEYFDSSARNVVTFLAEADVLVSDVSSVATQYLALDRPLVRLVDPARARASASYAPDGTEWELLPASTTVNRAQDVAGAVRAALAGAEPEAIQSNRRRLRERFFGSLTDGRAGERIAQNLAQLLHAGEGPH
jgi:CDP-Glycerol:Poly(glycerophosphate) glycerophosphotransferase